MTDVKRWTVDIYIDEHSDARRTYAEARLNAGDGTDVRGRGMAWRNPSDPEVPVIGDELAASRALADLAAKLGATAAADVEGLTEEASHGW